MSDFIWFVMAAVLFILLGLLFFGLGWQIWKKQRMDLIISYHSDKVREENRQAYCMLAGIGVLLMGIGFLLSGVSAALNQSVFAFVPMTAGLVIGTALLAYAVIRYNR